MSEAKLNELQNRILTLDAKVTSQGDRLKTLEDLLAEVTRVFLGAPKEMPKETEKPEKDFFKTENLIWVEQPPTAKGVWESTTQISNPDAQEIIKALEAAGKPLFSKNPDALYW